MEFIIDNLLVKDLLKDPANLSKYKNIVTGDGRIVFRWPSLLEYLGIGKLFSELPSFEEGSPLFEACLSALSSHDSQEMIFYIYDNLFAENLRHIQALPQINPQFLLQAIKEKRKSTHSLEAGKLLDASLVTYEQAFIEIPSQVMHDLVLYLAWDRMCAWMGTLFNFQSADMKLIKALSVLKECLAESYRHIFEQGRTRPGIYRMLESLVFYQMREENIQKHTDEEWMILSQSFPALKEKNELADFFYIDDAVVFGSKQTGEEQHTKCYATLDSVDKVSARLALAQCLMRQLKQDATGWDFIIRPQEMIYLGKSTYV